MSLFYLITLSPWYYLIVSSHWKFPNYLKLKKKKKQPGDSKTSTSKQGAHIIFGCSIS